ncbi:SGNH/GDSL hydrolase family protein [Clostridium cellulovorans]|uniref:Uncharacterized protein n=1 Tax=Clostridium cellulovorans (strain ATCC 35296 / DSM 3052 / OCM 3 / 743B) TaxID=573061 RepID=D9SRY1_CLOC7|nr:SGNH/GDSL hydrolase family protein [Clostridium cellulovorans]ADL50498.1 hypothetical protein Clocel_0727 [Clostridium cellulovorans 743B]
MDIIIFGTSDKRIRIEETLKNIHKIVGYTDVSPKVQYINNTKVYRLEDLKSISYDYIVLGIDNAKVCKGVIEYLIKKYKIESSKIVDFYYFYYNGVPSQKVDRVMQHPNNKDGYNGIILGLSHSEVGINPKYLKANFCNLSVSSQDIYYNLMTLKHCIKNYPDKIKNLRYAIIDMFDYTYFNFDVSLSNKIIHYYSWGGYHKAYHNYLENKRYSPDINDELSKKNFKIIESLSSQELTLRDELFENMYDDTQCKLFNDFPSASNRNKRIEKGFNDFCMPDHMPKHAKKRYQKTIDENISYFDEILNSLHTINANIKIYIVLIPRYDAVEEIHRIEYVNWKREFEEIIYKFQQKYQFKYLDFKDYKQISNNNNFYYDTAHLNYDGATAFTNLLNSHID